MGNFTGDRIVLSRDNTNDVGTFQGLEARTANLLYKSALPNMTSYGDLTVSQSSPVQQFTSVYRDAAQLSGQRSLDMPQLKDSLTGDSVIAIADVYAGKAQPPELVGPLDPTRSLKDLAKDGKVKVVERADSDTDPGNPSDLVSRPTIKIDYSKAPIDPLAKMETADIRVLKDGTIQCSEDLEEKLKAGKVAIDVEKSEQNKQSAAEKQSLDEIVKYLGRRMQMMQASDGVSIDDGQQLVSPAVKDLFPEEKPIEVPQTVRENVRHASENMAHHRTMSPQERDSYVPPRIKPKHYESPTTQLVKDAVASLLFPPGEHFPYSHACNRYNDGWGVGRYAMTYRMFVMLDWLEDLLGNPPDYSKMDKLVKDGKIKPDMAKMLKSPEFKQFMTGLKDQHHEPGDIAKFMPKELQELVAGQLIDKFGKQIVSAEGKTDIPKLIGAMVLGHVATEEDMKNPANKNLWSTIEAYKSLNESRIENPSKSFKWDSVGGVPITSPYGDREHPIEHKVKHHDGIDLGGHLGQPIHNTAEGTLIYRGWVQGFGNTVIAEHNVDGHTIRTLYGHMKGFSPELSHLDAKDPKNNHISAGTVIGFEGSTGNSTGPHLHFGVMDMRTRKWVNPMDYLEKGLLAPPMLRGE